MSATLFDVTPKPRPMDTPYTTMKARRESSQAAMPGKQKRYAQIMKVYATRPTDGLTPEEAAFILELDIRQTAPRCTELVKLGKLEETGERRETKMGRGAAVLRLAGQP